MSRKIDRGLAGILFAIGLLCLVSTLVLAADYNFAGVWKGEYGGTPAGGAPAARGNSFAEPQRGGGGGGGGGGRGGAGGGGPQKITLRVKVSKEKASGNFTMGTAAAEDIRDGLIDGNKMSFKTGLAPAAIYDYDAVLIGDDLSVTRTAEGGRGGRPQMFTLMRSK
jgi:hypothetical protein